ncbi:hypothetical protein IEQ34_003060 [Dendrobium chrysotoxum]|uniref:Uncharacterized protein n=1 Tax=Dendrobium chrysotoxum TaxID=161865 RepID=A0AAV7HGI5_DENCH|nr:hypothetical protein IEQ34_003060 [Dendrobium chrysotoxum]
MEYKACLYAKQTAAGQLRVRFPNITNMMRTHGSLVTNSGGRYHSVTTRLVSGCLFSGCMKFARPKSAIFNMPSSLTRRLAPLISRWIIPLE